MQGDCEGDGCLQELGHDTAAPGEPCSLHNGRYSSMAHDQYGPTVGCTVHAMQAQRITWLHATTNDKMPESADHRTLAGRPQFAP